MLFGRRHAGRAPATHRALAQGALYLLTVCPSGLRGWTQVPLAKAAWVQIPQLSFFVAGEQQKGSPLTESLDPPFRHIYTPQLRCPHRWKMHAFFLSRSYRFRETPRFGCAGECPPLQGTWKKSTMASFLARAVVSAMATARLAQATDAALPVPLKSGLGK